MKDFSSKTVNVCFRFLIVVVVFFVIQDFRVIHLKNVKIMAPNDGPSFLDLQYSAVPSHCDPTTAAVHR